MTKTIPVSEDTFKTINQMIDEKKAALKVSRVTYDDILKYLISLHNE